MALKVSHPIIKILPLYTQLETVPNVPWFLHCDNFRHFTCVFPGFLIRMLFCASKGAPFSPALTALVCDNVCALGHRPPAASTCTALVRMPRLSAVANETHGLNWHLLCRMILCTHFLNAPHPIP